ncbi:Long chain acyl-CoA synthetase 8 [Bienertia sinuspersici]
MGNLRKVFDRVCNFASGLVVNGHHVDSGVAIFADTKAEWFIALQTQVATLICNSKQLDKITVVRSKLATVKDVTYFAEDGGVSNTIAMDGLKVSSFDAIEKLGKNQPQRPRLPSKNDIAGVMMTHGNIIATVSAIMEVFPPIGRHDVYLAYLPLAHIFELEAEMLMLASGAAVGYGSILTMADTSSKIKKGTKGDASALQPTLMAVVPAILDRVRDGVLEKKVRSVLEGRIRYMLSGAAHYHVTHNDLLTFALGKLLYYGLQLVKHMGSQRLVVEELSPSPTT